MVAVGVWKRQHSAWSLSSGSKKTRCLVSQEGSWWAATVGLGPGEKVNLRERIRSWCCSDGSFSSR